MNWLPVLPFLICFLALIAISFSWSNILLQKIWHLLAATALFIAVNGLGYVVFHQGILVLQVGHYPAPYGISIVIDPLSAILLWMTGLINWCVSIYALADIHTRRQKLGFYPAYWVLLMGICGAFSTGDLFNLYVWFEVMLIASFTLLVLGNQKAQLDGTLKYVSLNLVATILMLLSIAMLYGMTGTLNMADLAQKLPMYPFSGMTTSIILLLALAFAIKAALFPLFFWLPAAYHTTNVTTVAIFAALLTKVGVYALIRLTILLLPNNHYILSLLLFSAGMTMLTGVLGAASQFHIRRLLSFHIISQIGYMVMGLAIYTPFALASAIFFMAHNMLAKTNLFLITGICSRIGHSSDIRKLGGFYQHFPVIAFLFFIPAFSLAGIPPSSGFWGKLLLLKAAFDTSHYFIAALSLFVSVLTLYSMTKIWSYIFWKETSSPDKITNLPLHVYYIYLLPIILLSLITLAMGFFPQFFFNYILQTTEQLFHPALYIQAVLGVQPG
jgi:multicomponent Na+:H+ antiporter subunit D